MGETPALTHTDLLYRTHEEIRAFQTQRFRHQIALCFRGHPYYQDVFNRLKLTPADFQTIEDVQKLPVTTKQDYLSNPEAFRLTALPEFLPQERILWSVNYTTGTTTGIPAPFFNTTHDFLANLELLKRLCAIFGMTENDTVVNLFPLVPIPHLGFRFSDCASVVGALVITPLIGTPYLSYPVHRSLDEAIRLIERHKGTVLGGIPSYLHRVIMRAEELGADFSRVRLILAVGEPCPRGTREDMRRRLQRLGASQHHLYVKGGLGFTELQGSTGECVELGGSHHPAPDQTYFEVLDEQGHTPLPDGKPGLFAVTHLDRRGTVLLRYAIGDLTAISHQVCPHCRRQGPRIITNTVRTFELIMLGGTLMNPDVLKEAVASVGGIDEYQLVFSKQRQDDPSSPDLLHVRVAAQEVEQERVRTELTDAVTAVASTPLSIEFVGSRSEIFDPDQDLKATRVVDLRPKGER